MNLTSSLQDIRSAAVQVAQTITTQDTMLSWIASFSLLVIYTLLDLSEPSPHESSDISIRKEGGNKIKILIAAMMKSFQYSPIRISP